ncbi:MAG: Gldg family protein, partial [Gammaproteobacteria bacterium]
MENNLFWFSGWLLALGALFTVALRGPELALRRKSSVARFTIAVVGLGAVLAIATLANVALTRHDQHFDFTREHVFTPEPDALAVVTQLDQPVRLTYFFRPDDPEGKRAKHIAELMGRQNRLLEVSTIDPDTHPTLAQTAGVKIYNAALLETDDRRLIVRSTDEVDIAIGIERVLRKHIVEICFLSGHGEYPSDNYEFHTHVESLGAGGSDHAHGGAGELVETIGHGVGRWRRSLEALGYEISIITPAIDGEIDSSCRVVIDAGPQTAYSTVETAALATYLEEGGAALLLYDLGFKVAPAHANLLGRLGFKLDDGVIVDPTLHYAADQEMVAVTAYEPHSVTKRISFTFYPGVRPVEIMPPIAGITNSPLFYTSKSSYIQALPKLGGQAAQQQGDDLDQHPYLIAAASSGRINPS